MNHDYRRRVRFLLDEKRKAEDQLQWWKDHKKTMSWFLRLMTFKARVDNELALEALIRAIDRTLRKISRHYWWHYTVSSNSNPYMFPNEIEVKIVSQGMIFERTDTITCRYTHFMK